MCVKSSHGIDPTQRRKIGKSGHGKGGGGRATVIRFNAWKIALVVELRGGGEVLLFL